MGKDEDVKLVCMGGNAAIESLQGARCEMYNVYIGRYLGLMLFISAF